MYNDHSCWYWCLSANVKCNYHNFTKVISKCLTKSLFLGEKDRAQTLPGRTGLGPGQQRPMIGRPMSVNSSFDSHTSHNHNPHPRDTSFARDSSFDSRRSGPDTGYYSDRNEAARNGYRDERGYLSDHSSRQEKVTS